MPDTLDLAVELPPIHALLADVHAGLARPRKSLRSRWLYDDRGSDLFESITAVDEYYPTRTEISILEANADEIAAFIRHSAAILEYGAGAARKTEILLDALGTQQVYVPIDIAGDFLGQTVTRIQARYPALDVRPLVADFTAPFGLPDDIPHRRTAFFPGSTLGNLDEAETEAFLTQMRRHVGPQGSALIGIDLRKNVDVLLAAYDDAAGVTAAFNLNLLARLNRELNADFRLEWFRHQSRWNSVESAVEMHLVSQAAQSVQIQGRRFDFAVGETIHTESSRKYDIALFGAMVARLGWRLEQVWRDPEHRFAVCGLRARDRLPARDAWTPPHSLA